MLTLDRTIHDHAFLRSAGKDVLSLALIEARNRTLAWASACEGAFDGHALDLAVDVPASRLGALDPPLWTLGHIAWFQERWIARNVQRLRGEEADPLHPRLASIIGDADPWYDPELVPRPRRLALAAGELPGLQATRDYLVETLETTLELLDAIAPQDGDDALYFHRLALFHEEMLAEGFAVLAQSLGFDPGFVRRPRASTTRAPIALPATRWLMGTGRPGFRFDNEAEPHPVALPEYEIDAQACTWAQYAEFVEDGGYDEPRHWSESGWAWVQREGRRTPRDVEQIRHGVLRRRFGVVARTPAGEAAVHVSAYEAEAWCRWAGRQLPSEAQWEAAAHRGAARGFRHGDVWEWTASTFAPYPGFVAGPWRAYSAPHFGRARVLRGGSLATAESLRSTRLRRWASDDDDSGFFGFRSSAL